MALLEVRGRPGPVLAIAPHDGHEVRPEVAALLAVSAEDRRREEDPFTGRLTDIGDLAIVATRSRFEVDLNRPRDRAVYLHPSDAWGLQVWTAPPPDDLLERSRELHDRAHELIQTAVLAALEVHEEVLLLDIHSYNHRRGGPDDPGDPAMPLLGLGTRCVDADRWGDAIDAFLHGLRSSTFAGAPIETELNTPFGGGELARRVSRAHGDRVLTLSVELRKSFMDEWTGELDEARLGELHAAVVRATSAVRALLR